MSNSRYTVVHFDYGGYYSKDEDEIQWNSRGDQIYSIMVKKYMEDVTYSDLVDRVCRKIMVDSSTTKLKCSYYPLAIGCKKPSYIWDDDDLYGYLVELDNVQRRSILNVEVIEEKSSQQSCEPLPRDDRGSGVRIEGFASDGKDNDGIVGNESESSEHLDLVEDVGHDDENGHCEDLLMFNYDHTNDKLTRDVQTTEVLEWEDGIDLVLGQEFKSKQEVQDLVEKAGLRNCFEIATIKSCSKLYVLKCREGGCKWSLRAAKLKNSDCFSVRTYNKMHTCTRVATSTRRNKRKNTPKLVASILHEDYPDQFNTLAPKNLIGMVQERFGVKISYSTAWRGKKQAVGKSSTVSEVEVVYS